MSSIEDTLAASLAEDWLYRLIEEQRELQEKINALNSFFFTDQFEGLSDGAKVDLYMQIGYMRGYNDTLNIRIEKENDIRFDAEQQRYDNMVKP